MQEPRPQGITLTRPSMVKEAGQDLLGPLFQPLGKLVSAGTLGPLAGVGDAVVDLVAKFIPGETTHQAAWRLVWLALRDTVDDLAKAARSSTKPGDSIDTAHLLQLGGDRVDLDRIEVPWGFLQRPEDLPLLPVIAGNLKQALVYLGTEPHAAKAVAARVPTRFLGFFYSRAMQQRDRLDQLRDLLHSEPATALRQWLNWQAYGAHMVSELNAPLFAGPFSLRQLNQPLRGYWTERREGEHGQSQQLHHAVYLTKDFDAWLQAFNKSDALRVVAGGPGSGKSSFVKCWAARVMRREQMIRTLLVPLHHLTTSEFEGEIGDYAKLHHFPTNPLDIDARERRLVLILDGLDELDVGGGDAPAELVRWVRKLLLRNRHGFEIQVVLTGRALIFEGLRRELEWEGRIYHVLGYAPCKVDAQWKDPGMLLEIDQRQAWWQRWGKRSGDGSTRMPDEIAGNENLAVLADEPLLNHLLAITRKDDPAALDSSSSKNSVYASLLRCVWKRTWGEMGQIAAVKMLTVDQFNRLFESIGLSVWQGGGRSTTLAEVAEVARLEKLDTVLPAFKEENKGALALLNAFFFRRAPSGETFELTHKTFGEYLAARRLARLIEELHGRLQSEAIDEVEGLRLWYQPTHAARITQEIVTFLEGELRAREPDDVHAWRASLIRLFHRALQTGMAHESVDGAPQPNQRAAQRFDANAELALFATIGACTEAIIHGTADQPVEERRRRVRWSPRWPDRRLAVRTSAWDLLRRLEAGTAHDTVARRAMQGLDLNDQIIGGDLSEARLTFASARKSQLRRANLFRAELPHTVLDDAVFRGANLSGAILDGASLCRADLRGANLIGAHFGKADLTYADLSASTLGGSDLLDVETAEPPNSFGPSFSGATLIRAKLIGSNLRGTSFRDANLTRAELTGANLTRADLSEADLSSAHLSSAILDGANLYGAILKRAILRGTDLSQVNLVGADLSGVDLSETIGLTRLQLQSALNVDTDRLTPDLPEGSPEDEWPGILE